MSLRHLVFAVMVFLSGHSQANSTPESQEKPLRVLFVGNSYTYENNLPFVFASLAQPIRDVEVTMVASGGATLRRHLDQGEAINKITNDAYDVVVLQEQSVLGPLQVRDGLVLIQDPAPFHEAVHEFAKAVRAKDARLVLFATWPRAGSPRSLAALHNAYVSIAKVVDATVAPVGLVWDRLGGDDCDDLHLYGPDGSHPSPEGTYVAAVTIARAIFGKTPPLRSVSKVPLMDGRAQLSGLFTDIDPSGEGIKAIEDGIAGTYKLADGEKFPLLQVPSTVPEPALPAELYRGRLTQSFLKGSWKGRFKTFGIEEGAMLTIDFAEDSAAIHMVYDQEEWPGDEDATVPTKQPDAGGVITLTFHSKGMNSTVEIQLVRVGYQLRGLVLFKQEGAGAFIRSPVALASIH